MRTAVRWLVKRPRSALFLEPGLAKTAIFLKAFITLKKAGKAHKALVIAPRRVCYMVWTKEPGGELWEWTDFHHLSLTLLHGPKKDALIKEDSDIYVINYAGLAWLIDNGHLKDLIKRGVDVLIVDELSKLKHTNVQRFKKLKPWLGHFEIRWGGTGSPASNGLINLFGQIFIIDQGAALGRFVTHYRHEFFIPSGYGGYTWKLQPGAEDRIYARLKNVALSMTSEDHLDLPQLLTRNIWINLPPKVRKKYNQLEEDLITSIGDQIVTAANAGVASAKCRQVASGGVYSDDDLKPSSRRKWIALHNEKTEALRDLVDELQGSPLLVSYEFNHDLERIRAEFGKDLPAINGKTSDKRSREIVQAWNRGELPILCGHPMAMAYGLNMQKSGGSHICFYSTPWDFELYDQLIRRVWRQGVKAKRITVHRILARDTVDEIVARVIGEKKYTQDALMKALRDLRKGDR